jgi:hypothetical protein
MLPGTLPRRSWIQKWVFLFGGVSTIMFWSLSICNVLPAQAAGGIAQFAIGPVITKQAEPGNNQFILQGSSGTSLFTSIHIVNFGTAVGTVDLYPVDGVTSQNSGISIPPKSAPRHDVGSWIVFSRQEVTLAAGQSTDVPFTLNIPKNVRDGQHGGVIVAEPVQAQTNRIQTTKKSMITINVHQRVAIGVLVTLPGPLIPNLQTTGITYGVPDPYQHVLIGLKNAGNTMLHAHGYLHIFTLQGHLLQNYVLQLKTIMPQDSIQYPVYMQHKVLPLGTYRAELLLQYNGQKSLYAKSLFAVHGPKVARFVSAGRLISLATESVATIPTSYYLISGALLSLLIGTFIFLTYRWRRTRRTARQ